MTRISLCTWSKMHSRVAKMIAQFIKQLATHQKSWKSMLAYPKPMGFMLAMPCSTLLRMINPRWLAHRGSWHNEFKENSIPAFNNTVQRLGFWLDGFECDLRQYSQKSSESWVIHHDPFPTKNKQPWRQFKTRKDHLFLPDFCSWISEQSTPFTLNIEIKSGSPSGVSFLVDALPRPTRTASFPMCFQHLTTVFFRPTIHWPLSSIPYSH